MKNAFQLIALLSLIISAPMLATTIYKTVKADGTVVYSDVPSRDSVPVNMVQGNNVVIPKLADPVPMEQNSLETKKSNTQYQITVLSPLSQETIRNNNGEVNISFEISPDYVGKSYLLLDNQIVNTRGKTQIRLNNIERGEHFIEVQLRDNSGKVFASSGKQTFYLHKASALINAN
jgi:hypothetical protein